MVVGFPINKMVLEMSFLFFEVIPEKVFGGDHGELEQT